VTLNSSERRQLRSLAHSLEPSVQIGQRGLTEPVIAEIDLALNTHELIKVRFRDYKDQKSSICDQISERLSAETVGIVGHIAILYRQNPDPEKRKIRIR
jgi:RNA-binding protein